MATIASTWTLHKHQTEQAKFFPAVRAHVEVVSQIGQARESTTQQFLVEMRSGAWSNSAGHLVIPVYSSVLICM
jgi:hypothetical protein